MLYIYFVLAFSYISMYIARIKFAFLKKNYNSISINLNLDINEMLTKRCIA